MLIYDSNENKFQSSLRKVLKNNEVKSEKTIIEAFGEKYDGSVLQLQLSIGAHVAEKHKLFTVIMHDVSERKREEEFYKNAFKNSPIGIFILHEGEFKFVNLKFLEYTGYSEEELLEMESMDLIVPEDRDFVRENAIKMLKGNKSTPYEYRIRLKNGNIKWVMETASSIEYKGERSTLGNIIDIDDQKSLNEVLSRTNKELSGRVEELIEHNKHVALLNEMGEVIQSSPTLEEAYKTINHNARQFFPEKSGTLCLLDQSDEYVEVVSEWGRNAWFQTYV
jgi:PAS domain S-box-containing protein